MHSSMSVNTHSHVKSGSYNLTAITRKQSEPTKNGQRTRMSRDDLDTATSKGSDWLPLALSEMQVKAMVTNRLVASRMISAFRKEKALAGLWRSWDPVHCSWITWWSNCHRKQYQDPSETKYRAATWSSSFSSGHKSKWIETSESEGALTPIFLDHNSHQAEATRRWVDEGNMLYIL